MILMSLFYVSDEECIKAWWNSWIAISDLAIECFICISYVKLRGMLSKQKLQNRRIRTNNLLIPNLTFYLLHHGPTHVQRKLYSLSIYMYTHRQKLSNTSFCRRHCFGSCRTEYVGNGKQIF